MARIGGRQAGTPNKMTRTLKEMILQALDDAGGVAYLQRQAEENPGPFLALVGKVLPMQVSGSDGGPIKINVVSGVPIEASFVPLIKGPDDHG